MRHRVPLPLIKSRLPSGRGSMEQPNVTGDGDTPLTLRFWVAVVVSGVVTGLFGALLMAVLFQVSYWAFGFREELSRSASSTPQTCGGWCR